METNEQLYHKFLIEVPELIILISSQDNLKSIRIIDATCYPPGDTRDRNIAFNQIRIPHSQFFDIDKIADTTATKFPHMMPSNETFIQQMKSMDIRISDQIIIYDRVGMFSSPRVWYTFKLFGHQNVKVLNGGFPAWEKANGPTEKDTNFKIVEDKAQRSIATNTDYDYHLDIEKVIDIKELIKKSVKITKGELNEEIIDARSEDRFLGKAPEPRKSLRVGSIDGSKNVFFKLLLDDCWKFKKPAEIEEVFKSKNIDINKVMTCSCGSGLTACIDIFGLCLIGKYDLCRLYDASWIEFGNISEEDLIKIKQEVK